MRWWKCSVGSLKSGIVQRHWCIRHTNNAWIWGIWRSSLRRKEVFCNGMMADNYRYIRAPMFEIWLGLDPSYHSSRILFAWMNVSSKLFLIIRWGAQTGDTTCSNDGRPVRDKDHLSTSPFPIPRFNGTSCDWHKLQNERFVLFRTFAQFAPCRRNRLSYSIGKVWLAPVVLARIIDDGEISQQCFSQL